MPAVFIVADRSHEKLTKNRTLLDLGDVLRIFVAEALTCSDPGGQLTANDVEVHIFDRRHLLQIGGEQFALQVTVVARELPERRAYLEERSKELQRKFKAICPPDVTGYIWVLLPPGAFVPF